MHGQRDLLDWQDECKRGNRRREARRNVEARGERVAWDGEWSEKEQ